MFLGLDSQRDFPQMMAVCNTCKHYGRIDPTDRWLPAFQCLDGLVIEADNQSGKLNHYRLKPVDSDSD